MHSEALEQVAIQQKGLPLVSSEQYCIMLVKDIASDFFTARYCKLAVFFCVSLKILA